MILTWGWRIAARTNIPSTNRKKKDCGLQIPFVTICRIKPTKTSVCRAANIADKIAAKVTWNALKQLKEHMFLKVMRYIKNYHSNGFT